MLVRARSPHLAVIHGFTLLITTDVFIVQEIVQSAGKHMPCTIGYWSVNTCACMSTSVHRACCAHILMIALAAALRGSSALLLLLLCLMQCNLQVFLLYGCITLAYPLR